MNAGLLDAPTIQHAGRLWTYMSATRAHEPSDAVVVSCSYDQRGCDYACELLGRNLATRPSLSCRSGNWTKHLWAVAEAAGFRNRVISNAVAPLKIVVEDESTNFGENIALVGRLLPDVKRVTFVTKPNSVLRVALTVPVRWPGTTAFVDAPPLVFLEDVSNVVGVFGLISEWWGTSSACCSIPFVNITGRMRFLPMSSSPGRR